MHPIRAQILRDLVAYWPLDEAAGAVRKAALWTPAASPGTHLDLADTNTVASITGPTGELPLAAGFTRASSQKLQVTNSHILRMSNQPVSFWGWVKMTDITLTQSILTKYDNAARAEFIIYATSSRFRIRTWAGASDSSVAATAIASTFGAPTNGVWYFVAVRFYPLVSAKDQRAEISVNGGAWDVASTTGAATAFADSTAPLQFGNGLTNGFLGGGMAGWGIKRGIVTAQQVNYLYNGGRGRNLRAAA